MDLKRRIFLDTSALFAGIWSESGGSRLILRLGEAGALQIVVSQQVLNELEEALRWKAPHLLATLARLLDRIQAEVCGPGNPQKYQACLKLSGQAGDARILANAHILADAWQAEVSYLVSLNQKHILNHPEFNQVLPFEIGTPGDFVQRFRDLLEKNNL